jgi:hypothetical protein
MLIRKARLLIGAPVLLLGLVSCSSKTSIDRYEMAQKVCETDLRTPDTINAIQTVSGSVIYGNVTNFATAELPELWGSVYATRSSSLKDTGVRPGLCCASNGFQTICGPMMCRYEDVTDVSFLYGRAYASDQYSAERIARDNCRQIVGNWQTENDQTLPYSLRCQKLVTQRCR